MYCAFAHKKYKKAFYNIKMSGVEGKNPISKEAVQSKVFDKPFEEKNYILMKIIFKT